MFNDTMVNIVNYNVPTLGEVADLKPETVKIAMNLIRKENIILTENTAILPNVCYRLMRFNYLKFNTKYESSFYFLGWEQK